MFRVICWMLGSIVMAAPVVAQGSAEVMNAGNIARLESVSRIDFEALSSVVGRMELGWFVLSKDGERLAVRNRANELIVLDTQGRVLDRYAVPGRDGLPATVLDADFNATGDMLASVHLDGMGYDVAYRQIGSQSLPYFRFETSDSPLRIWFDEQVWLEVSPNDPHEGRYVERLLPGALDQYQPGAALSGDEISISLSGPENDPDAFLRIGRIMPPFALTVTQAGWVKRWNLETGEATATAAVNTVPGAGQLNASGRHFVWRDANSRELYLLDFETGDNRLVAPLNGAYVPFLFLTPQADAAIGVNVGLEPVVAAWDTATGERYDLGEYRACGRQPDVVRLSRDGTMLVIGCDTGLDIWRILGE